MVFLDTVLSIWRQFLGPKKTSSQWDITNLSGGKEIFQKGKMDSLSVPKVRPQCSEEDPVQAVEWVCADGQA